MPETPNGGDKTGEMALKIKFKWPALGGPAPVYSNHFSLTTVGNEVLLEFGQMLPIGIANKSKQEIEEQLRNTEMVVVGRVVMEKHSAVALKRLMDQHIKG
jgi:hypothetical protein